MLLMKTSKQTTHVYT